MKPKELADWLGLSPSTIRTWASGQFRRYLSPSAQGGDGRARNFTEQDARIVALIANLKQENVPVEEIQASLTQLQTEDWGDLPPMPPAPPGSGPIPMMPREVAETAVTTQRAALMREISILQERVENLEEQLADERQARSEERATLQTELLETKERLGELRGKLAERRPASWWLTVVAAAVLATVIIAGIVIAVLLSSGGVG